MPRNMFRDPFDGLQQGYDTAQGITNDIRSNYAGRRAAPKIAQGDYGGAAQEYGDMGMADEARQMQRGQLAMDDRAADTDAQQGQQRQAAAQKRVEILTKVAGALKGVPPGRRKAALAQATPLFELAEVDPTMFDGLTEEQLTDQSLDTFTGELQSQYKQFFQNDQGIFGVTPDGKVDALQQFERKPTIVPSGSVALGSDGKPMFKNPRTFAPPRPGSAKRAASEMSDAELLAIAQGGR